MNRDALYALWVVALFVVIAESVAWAAAEHEMSYRRERRTTPPLREDAPSAPIFPGDRTQKGR